VLPSPVSTTYSGTTALSLFYSRDLAVEPKGECSFTAASTLTTGLSGGAVIHACLYLVGCPEDELGLRLQLLLGPWPDSSMHPPGDVFVIVSSQQRSLWLGGEALVILSTTSGVGVVFIARHIVHIRSGGCLCHWLALAMALVFTHTHTYNRHDPAMPGIFIVAQALASQHPLHLELGAPAAVMAMSGLVAGTTRGRCVRPDGDSARPLAVALLAVIRRGGYGLHHPWTRRIIFDFYSAFFGSILY
jgi:hypothetical protein